MRNPTMKLVFWSALLSVSSLLGDATLETIKDISGLTIKTPSLQNWEQGKFRLSNGMDVYVIADPDAEQAACALSVRAGSWQDPEEFPGLAHLLEHMLFMGTEKYPKTNGFWNFLSDHSGTANACTWPEKTLYMFSIDADHFSEGLDRFSEFFIAPRLDPSCIAAELLNVDQEHEKNVVNDFRREYMVFKELCHPDHPHRKFSTGNAKTLGKIPAERVQRWFTDHYSASEMCLVVYAPNSLPELQELITEKFSSVPKRSKPSSPPLPTLFEKANSSSMTYIDPVKDLDVLKIRWELPQEFLDDESKSLELITYALSRGQKWSVSELLQKEELIDSAQMYTTHLGGAYPLLCIDLALTKKGVQEKESVISHLFSAIYGLKRSSIPLYLFHERNTMQELSYAYQVRQKPYQFVMQHAQDLLQEDLATYPKKTLLASSFDAKKVAKALDLLTPERAHFVLITAEKNAPFPYTKKERWMGVSYEQAPLSRGEMLAWKNAPTHPDIRLATPNLYLPKNLTIVPKEEALQKPVKFIDNALGKMFLMQGHEFSSPEVMHIVQIHSPKIDKSIQSALFMDLYLEIMEKKLAPTTLSAAAAGLSIHFGYKKGALQIQVEGYSEKASLLLEECLRTLLASPIDHANFTLAKTALQKYFSNSKHDLPIHQGIDLLQSLLRQDHHTKQEKALALKNLSYEDLISWQKTLFHKAYVEGFLSGNLSRKEAEVIWIDVASLLEPEVYPKESLPKFLPLTLPEEAGPYYLQREALSNGTGVILTIDQGPSSGPKKASQSILAKALHEGFFHTLRTEQNTAYIASASPSDIEDHLYQNFLVQSSSHTAMDLLYRFELFIETFLQEFPSKFPQKRFESIRDSLVAELEKPHRNLAKKTSLFYDMAFRRKENFLYQEEKKEALQMLSYEEFAHFTKDWLSRGNTKRLGLTYQGALGRPFAYDPLSNADLLTLLQSSSSD